MVIIDNKTIMFSISNIEDLNDVIPNGVWLVKFDNNKGEFFLEKQDDFIIPNILFGEINGLSDRYLRTFNEGDKNLGIALTGLKGTGKSLLAKTICSKSNIPTLIITDKYSGSNFSSFLSNIKQDIVVFVDEFEKVYANMEAQESFLSVLDGVFMGKKLFIFTSNETSKYSNYLINRPGRIHYMKRFERISDEMLNDIINVKLDNKHHIDELKEVIGLIDDANIDMVFALLNECNRYKESPKESVKYLNIIPTESKGYKLNIKYIHNNCNYECIINDSPITKINRHYTALMSNEDKDRLTKEQIKDKINYPHNITLILNYECKIEREGRNIISTYDNYIVYATPIEDYKFKF